MSSAVALSTGGYISNGPSATPMATGGYIDLFSGGGILIVTGLIIGVLTEEIDLKAVMSALETPEGELADTIDVKATLKEKI